MKRELYIFWQFCKRDMHVYRQRVLNYSINEIIIRPFMFGIAFGYLLPNLSITGRLASHGILFIGTIVYVLMSLASSIIIDLWIDIDGPQHCTYQMSMLSPHLFLAQKLLCGTVVIFLCAIPVYPLAQILLGNPFPQLTLLRFPLLLLLLWCASLLIITFTCASLLFVQHLTQMRKFWRRWVHVLANFGGVVVPQQALITIIPLLGYFTYANPLMYITEGLRQVLIGGPTFLSAPMSLAGMLVSTVLLFVIAFYKLRSRLDPLDIL